PSTSAATSGSGGDPGRRAPRHASATGPTPGPGGGSGRRGRASRRPPAHRPPPRRDRRAGGGTPAGLGRGGRGTGGRSPGRQGPRTHGAPWSGPPPPCPAPKCTAGQLTHRPANDVGPPLVDGSADHLAVVHRAPAHRAHLHQHAGLTGPVVGSHGKVHLTHFWAEVADRHGADVTLAVRRTVPHGDVKDSRSAIPGGAFG